MFQIRSIFSLLLSMALVSACGLTGTGTPKSQQPTTVRLFDSRNDLHLELATTSDQAWQSFHSQQRLDGRKKLASPEAMHRLVEGLNDAGFEKLAISGSPSDSSELRGFISVHQGETRKSFSLPRLGATEQQLRAFGEMKLLMDQYYRSVPGLQYITNPDGTRFLHNEQSKLERRPLLETTP
ncbi:MAG: hypothetical protein VX916_03105 [Planctomycetota bacterium]|nr:hypothetical protein [Planctomycetota bacterium]